MFFYGYLLGRRDAKKEVKEKGHSLDVDNKRDTLAKENVDGGRERRPHRGGDADGRGATLKNLLP